MDHLNFFNFPYFLTKSGFGSRILFVRIYRKLKKVLLVHKLFLIENTENGKSFTNYHYSTNSTTDISLQ